VLCHQYGRPCACWFASLLPLLHVDVVCPWIFYDYLDTHLAICKKFFIFIKYSIEIVN
jgi:hypothetical protein